MIGFVASCALMLPFKQVVGYIQKKDWDRARTALRLYTYETRKSMTRLTSASGDPVSQPGFLSDLKGWILEGVVPGRSRCMQDAEKYAQGA
jgi:hypothetical protein